MATPGRRKALGHRGQVRDSIHYAKPVDRFFQNARRFLGYELQYCGTLEPQRRLAPHLHALLRGTVSRADLRRIVAATYHQVWWPQADEVIYVGRHLPVWDEHHAGTRSSCATLRRIVPAARP
jgi:hypothetical protein